jgi:hypothetical protein
LISVGSSLLREIPESWYNLMYRIVERTDLPCLTLEELDEMFPDDKERFVLQYLHDIGKVMWYRNRPKLADIVFHRIEVLTELVVLIFDHSSQEVWSKRIKSFVPFPHDGKGVNKKRYEEMVNDFLSTGKMNSVLLFNLIEQESELSPDTAVEVLRVFHLVCGPIQNDDESHYIIPYFSTKVINLMERENYIPMKVELCFNGLGIPSYAYFLLTAIYVDLHINDFNRIDVGRNGARVMDTDGTIKYIIHSNSDRMVHLIVFTRADTIAASWKDLLTTLNRLTSEVDKVWKGAHYETVFYCSHCLLSKQDMPTTQVDPKWYRNYQSSRNDQHQSYTGKEVCVCSQNRRSEVPLSPPYPLQYPCKFIARLGV